MRICFLGERDGNGRMATWGPPFLLRLLRRAGFAGTPRNGTMDFRFRGNDRFIEITSAAFGGFAMTMLLYAVTMMVPTIFTRFYGSVYMNVQRFSYFVVSHT